MVDTMKSGCEYSYGWNGHDDEDGWTERFYFTYYTSLGKRNVTDIVSEAILFIIILVLSLLTNLAIIIVVIRRKEIRTVTNCFIFNLACADLVFALSIPAIIVARSSPSWILGSFTCKLLPYFQFICGSVLLWTLTAISFDRVRCLSSSSNRIGLNHKITAIICLTSWLVAIILYLPVPLFFRLQKVENYTLDNGVLTTIHNVSTTICTLVFPADTNINSALFFTTVITVITSIIPILILIVNCYIILKNLSIIQKRLEERVGVVEQTPSKFRQSIQSITNNFWTTRSVEQTIPNVIHRPRMSMSGGFYRLKKHKRAIRILFSNILAVLIMWLPITVVMFLIYVDGHRDDFDFFLTNQYFVWSVIIALMNTIVNPILYGFLTDNFKDYYPWKRWMRKLCCAKTNTPMDISSNQNQSYSSRNASVQNTGFDNNVISTNVA